MKQIEGSRTYLGFVATDYGYVVVRQGRPLYGGGWTQLHYIVNDTVFERRFASVLFDRSIISKAREFAQEIYVDHG